MHHALCAYFKIECGKQRLPSVPAADTFPPVRNMLLGKKNRKAKIRIESRAIEQWEGIFRHKNKLHGSRILGDNPSKFGSDVFGGNKEAADKRTSRP